MQKDFQRKYSKVVAKAWSDPKFKEQLIKNPEQVLRSEGFEVPKNVKLTICENTETQFFLVLPQKPETELTEVQLESISGGDNCGSYKACDWTRCRSCAD